MLKQPLNIVQQEVDFLFFKLEKENLSPLQIEDGLNFIESYIVACGYSNVEFSEITKPPMVSIKEKPLN
jgi:hypothetical protein